MSCTALTLGFSAKDFLKLEKNLVKDVNYTASMTTAVTYLIKIIDCFTAIQIPTTKAIDDFYKAI